MLFPPLTTIVKNKYFSALLIILILGIGFFLRFYQIAHIPNGLYPDETAIGYNSYSILMTGKDEYGIRLPLYFRSFDDFKLPVYIYATALSIKAFGVSAFSVRFMSALFGSLTIVALYFLIYELSKKKLLAGLAAFFIAVNPWHTFFSRVGYEVNLATAFLVIGMLCFIAAVNRKNNFLLFLFSIVAFLLSLYTYNVTRLISPLIFVTLVLLYYKQITVTSKKLLVTLFLVFFAGALPFLVTFFQLQSQAGFATQQDALLVGKVAKAEILQTKSYFAFLPQIIQKTFFSYWVLLAWKFLGNLVSFFSTGFFFTVGADHPHENIAGFGMFYYFDLPLMLFGAYQGIKKKVSFLNPFYLWFLFMLLVGSIIVPIPKDDAFGTRTYAVVIPLIVFSAYGMYSLLEIIMGLKNKLVKTGIVSSLVILIAYSCIFYFTSYFIRFPVEYAKEWGSEDQKTIQYVESIAKNYNNIVFDDSTGMIYTTLLFYAKYPPQLHQQQAVYKQNGLVVGLSKDGKYEFRKVDWGNELTKKGTLFVTGANVLPNVTPLATFSYPTRPVVIYYDRQIAQYPTTETAYKIFVSGESK